MYSCPFFFNLWPLIFGKYLVVHKSQRKAGSCYWATGQTEEGRGRKEKGRSLWSISSIQLNRMSTGTIEARCPGVDDRRDAEESVYRLVSSLECCKRQRKDADTLKIEDTMSLWPLIRLLLGNCRQMDLFDSDQQLLMRRSK